MIGICSYCVLDRPIFERRQTLLHPDVTLWWSFLLAHGAHHKRSHSPTHPSIMCTQRSGYWYSGANTPGHQYPLIILCIGPVSRKTRTTRTPAFWGYPPPPPPPPPPPRRLMITHTNESYWIPSQNKVERPWRYKSRSKVVTSDTPSHASDHLYQIWK